MKFSRRNFTSSAIAASLASFLIAGPAITAEWPDIIEAKGIAEEGFIYGLPLVMNYAVMQEFAVDTNSGQFKAPFNEINNMHHVADPRRYSDRHAEQRHAILVTLAGSARRTDGDLGAGGGEGALLLRATHRRQYLQFRLHRHPRHGVRSGRLSRGRPRLEGRKADRYQQVFPRQRRSRSPFSGPNSSIPTICRTWKKCRPATRCSRFLPSWTSRTACRAEDRFPSCHHRRDQGQLLRLSRRGPGVRAGDARDKAIRAKLARSASAPARSFDFKDLPLGHKAEIGLGMKEAMRRSTSLRPAETNSSTAGASVRSLATGPFTRAIG